MLRWFVAVLVTLLAFSSTTLAQPLVCPCEPSVRTCACDKAVDAALEIASVDQRAAYVAKERSRIRLGAPVAVMATGLGVAAVLAVGEFFIWVGKDTQAALHDDDYRASEHPIYRALGFASLGAGLVGAGGLGWLIARGRMRRPYTRELDELQQRRMKLTPMVGVSCLGLRASATF